MNIIKQKKTIWTTAYFDPKCDDLVESVDIEEGYWLTKKDAMKEFKRGDHGNVLIRVEVEISEVLE